MANYKSILGCLAWGLVAVIGCGESEDESTPSAGGAGGSGGTSVAGSGGTSTGGIGGSATGGTAGTSTGGVGGSAGCNGCVPSDVSWGYNGGRVMYQDRSTLSPCNTYSWHRQPSGAGGATLDCTQSVPGCSPDSTSISDVNDALSHPDMVTALGAAQVLYGEDPRPYDGSLFEMVVDQAVIQIGDDCAPGSTTCVPPTPGMLAAKDVLQGLDTEQLAVAPCVDVVP